jgi:hypothetical protein
MNTAKRLSNFFGILALVLILLTVLITFLSLNAPVRVIGGDKAAEKQTAALMDAICSKDYDLASTLLVGNPQLKAQGDPESDVAALFWDAYRNSLSYEFAGGCYSGGSGMRRDVTVTMLDIPAMMQTLKEQFPAVLNAEVESTDDALVYNTDGTYRDDFVMKILIREVEALLQTAPQYTSRTVTLQLSSRNGQWLIQPDQMLMSILTGSIGG